MTEPDKIDRRTFLKRAAIYTPPVLIAGQVILERAVAAAPAGSASSGASDSGSASDSTGQPGNRPFDTPPGQAGQPGSSCPPAHAQAVGGPHCQGSASSGASESAAG